jgi:hypothetical protein
MAIPPLRPGIGSTCTTRPTERRARFTHRRYPCLRRLLASRAGRLHFLRGATRTTRTSFGPRPADSVQ